MSEASLVCALCRKPSSLRCGGCRRVAYCSKDHQKTDWKVHKTKCSRPVRGISYSVGENEEVGRHLVAARAISAGEVILEEAPLVSGPLQQTSPVCLGCYAALSKFASKDCSRCGWPVCSNACERSPAHRPECQITQRYKKDKVAITAFQDGLHHPSYQCITVLRCLELRESNREAWDKLSKLESHCKERRSTEKYESDLLMIARFIPRFFDYREFSEEEILRVAGIVQVNAHHVPLADPGYISIYDRASMLEHCCHANCSKSFSADGKVVVRAARAIRAGEHLSISYVEPLWGARERMDHLLETKFFRCGCCRCADPTELGTHFNSVRCFSRECEGFAVPRTAADGSRAPWRCTACGGTFSDDEATSLLRRIREDVLANKGSRDGCRTLLKRLGKHLHPNHHLVVLVKMALVQIHEEDDGFRGCSAEELAWVVDTCKVLIELASRLVPAENRLRGILHFQLHSALVEQGGRESAAGGVGDAELGRRLRMYRDVLEKAYAFLKSEPEVLPEGKMAAEARRYISDIDNILGGGGGGYVSSP